MATGGPWDCGVRTRALLTLTLEVAIDLTPTREAIDCLKTRAFLPLWVGATHLALPWDLRAAVEAATGCGRVGRDSFQDFEGTQDRVPEASLAERVKGATLRTLK